LWFFVISSPSKASSFYLNRPWPVRDAQISHTFSFNRTGRSRGFFCILFSSIGKKFVREATERGMVARTDILALKESDYNAWQIFS